jgi:chemotaxis protein MotB
VSKKKEKAGLDPNAWMITFSDLLTLMLTFFVLILSMSSMDDMKLKEAFGALQGAVGVMELGKGADVSPDTLVNFKGIQAATRGDLMRLFEELKRAMNVKNNEIFRKFIKIRDAQIEVKSDVRGAVLALPDMVLFPPGQATLHEKGKELLGDIGLILRRSTNLVSVGGHTDDRPPASDRYPTGWDLSMARALSVLHYLVEEYHLLPQRFIATGYGSNRSLAANDTSAGRAKNRRVEIVLLKDRTFWR